MCRVVQPRYTGTKGEHDGKVLWHLTMSLDGFAAGPGHSMDWLAGDTGTPGIEEEAAANLGAVLGGRRGYDAAAARFPGQVSRLPYGDLRSGRCSC